MTAMLVVVAMLHATGVSGNVPAGGDLQPTGSISWVPSSPSLEDREHKCQLLPPTQWTCPDVAVGDSGAVIIGGDNGVVYILVGPAGIIASGRAAWGRLVRVADGGIGTREDLRVSTWVIDRPSSRPNTRRLDAVPADSVEVVKISDRAFWISGRLPSADTFLRVEGAGLAQQDRQMLTIAEGAPESPFVLQLTPAVSISGRVETRSGSPVEGALVEVFERPPGTLSGREDERAAERGAVVRLAGVTSDADGRFDFPGLADGTYEVVATSFLHGRLSRWTVTTNPPLLLRLVPPTTVTGRVVRQKLPVPDARVRFVPDSDAWRKSTDPTSHLTTETRSDDGGRFTLPLPPEAAGDVQIIAPDGASLRKTLPTVPNLTDIALGDVALAELIALEIRADVPDCRMNAIGPAGALGFSVVPGRVTSTIYQFDLPEAGQWFLDAECSGQHASVHPSAVQVDAGRRLSFDVHLAIVSF